MHETVKPARSSQGNTFTLSIDGEQHTYTNDKEGKRQAILDGLAAIETVDVGQDVYLPSNAALQAAKAARKQILDAAAKQSNVTADEMDLREGHVVQADNGVSIIKLDRLLRQMHFGEDAELVMVSEYFEPDSELEDENHVGNLSATWAHGAYVAEVEVDTETGEVRVEKITAVQDVGKVINRLGIEGQMEGGISVSLGYALSEELKIEEGKVLNPNFRDYKVFTAPETPEIELHFVEHDCKASPLGSKGIAELPAIIPAPAIANAVYNAIGIRFFAPPLTPEKVARALHGAESE